MDSYNKRRQRLNQVMQYIFRGSASLLIVIIAALLVFIAQQGVATFSEVSVGEFFGSSVWRPDAGQFGALAFIWGSLLVTAGALLVGAPLGIAGAIFLAKVAPAWMRSILQPAVNLYLAIPSVVYGFIGLTVVVPSVREVLGVSGGFGIFTASLILGLMILPTIIAIAADALRAVPPMLEEGSLALGATEWQTIWHIVLPAALPGLVTAVVLGMARAIGETMAVQMVIGNAPQLATGLFMPTSTLPSEIVVEMGNTPFGSAWGNSLFLMALVLLLISLGLILVVRRLSAGKGLNR